MLAMYCAERQALPDVPRARKCYRPEHHVHLGALGGARKLDVVIEIDAGVGLTADAAGTSQGSRWG
jgi:hypothetical protein